MSGPDVTPAALDLDAIEAWGLQFVPLSTEPFKRIEGILAEHVVTLIAEVRRLRGHRTILMGEVHDLRADRDRLVDAIRTLCDEAFVNEGEYPYDKPIPADALRALISDAPTGATGTEGEG